MDRPIDSTPPIDELLAAYHDAIIEGRAPVRVVDLTDELAGQLRDAEDCLAAC